ncbi:MAG TPA: iron-sulfur cluster repair di-iron protein [Oscillatoriaceae cyanobacterium]
MRTDYLETPVGVLVAERPGRADVFDRYHIDYCCGGKLPLRWYCDKKGVATNEVLQALDRADAAPPQPHGQSLRELIAHVVGVHHVYLRAVLPHLGERLAKVVPVHGPAHAELYALQDCFQRFHDDMAAHMDQEERVLFPLIIRLERGLEDQALGKRFLNQQLATADAEHTQSGALLERMEALTEHFATPEGACATYHALYAELAEMVADTRRHVHKENTLLFPRAAALVANPPEPRPRYGEQANRGEIDFAEKQPADPVKDASTRAMSHEGGLASARNELY